MIYISNTAKGLKPASKDQKEECQDKVLVKKIEIGETEQVGIFALADGAGSAKCATEGAGLVTQFFVEEAEVLVKSSIDNEELISKKVLGFLVARVRERLQHHAKTQELKIGDYHTTLAVGIYHATENRQKLVCGSVGDSIVVVLEETEKQLLFAKNKTAKELQKKSSLKKKMYEKLLKKLVNISNTVQSCRNISKLTKGEFINQTAFFTSNRWKEALHIEVVENPLGLFLSSDGLNNVYFKYFIVEENTQTEDTYKRWIWDVELNEDYIWNFYNAIKQEKMDNELLEKVLNAPEILEINNDDKSFIFSVFK